MSRTLAEIEAEITELWDRHLPREIGATDAEGAAWWDVTAERDERLAELYKQMLRLVDTDLMTKLIIDARNYRRAEARRARTSAAQLRARAEGGRS